MVGPNLTTGVLIKKKKRIRKHAKREDEVKRQREKKSIYHQGARPGPGSSLSAPGMSHLC